MDYESLFPLDYYIIYLFLEPESVSQLCSEMLCNHFGEQRLLLRFRKEYYKWTNILRNFARETYRQELRSDSAITDGISEALIRNNSPMTLGFWHHQVKLNGNMLPRITQLQDINKAGKRENYLHEL